MPDQDPNLFKPFSAETFLEQDLQPHFEAWKAKPSPENSTNLLKAVDPIINRGMKTYARGSATSPTIRSKARQIALKSFGNYDPTKSKLGTYLMYQLQSLQRATAKEERIVSAPEQLLLDSKHLYDATNKLRDELGRDPSDVELSDHISMPIKRISYIRKLKSTVPEGAFSQQAGSSDNESFDPGIVQRHGGDDGWMEFVYHDLDPINQLIFEHTLGLHEKPRLSNIQIAKKLGISPGAISQRKAIIQSKLDQRDELGVL